MMRQRRTGEGSGCLLHRKAERLVCASLCSCSHGHGHVLRVTGEPPAPKTTMTNMASGDDDVPMTDWEGPGLCLPPNKAVGNGWLLLVLVVVFSFLRRRAVFSNDHNGDRRADGGDDDVPTVVGGDSDPTHTTRDAD